MTIIDTLITDRTADDVARLNALHSVPVSEWTEADLYYYLHGDPEALSATDGDLYATDGLLVVGEGVIRGAYNADDLNRVGKAVAYLAAWFRVRGYELPVAPKTDWTAVDIPTQSQMERYRYDIAILRQALPLAHGTPDAPTSMERLGYVAANNIERILIAVDDALVRLELAFYHSGEFYAGEV